MGNSGICYKDFTIVIHIVFCAALVKHLHFYNSYSKILNLELIFRLSTICINIIITHAD